VAAGIVDRMSGYANQKELTFDDQVDHNNEVVAAMNDRGHPHRPLYPISPTRLAGKIYPCSVARNCCGDHRRSAPYTASGGPFIPYAPPSTPEQNPHAANQPQ
jgi:hypothetical protein